jgi:hypothetical protein
MNIPAHSIHTGTQIASANAGANVPGPGTISEDGIDKEQSQ